MSGSENLQFRQMPATLLKEDLYHDMDSVLGPFRFQKEYLHRKSTGTWYPGEINVRAPYTKLIEVYYGKIIWDLFCDLLKHFFNLHVTSRTATGTEGVSNVMIRFIPKKGVTYKQMWEAYDHEKPDAFDYDLMWGIEFYILTNEALNRGTKGIRGRVNDFFRDLETYNNRIINKAVIKYDAHSDDEGEEAVQEEDGNGNTRVKSKKTKGSKNITKEEEKLHSILNPIVHDIIGGTAISTKNGLISPTNSKESWSICIFNITYLVKYINELYEGKFESVFHDANNNIEENEDISEMTYFNLFSASQNNDVIRQFYCETTHVNEEEVDAEHYMVIDANEKIIFEGWDPESGVEDPPICWLQLKMDSLTIANMRGKLVPYVFPLDEEDNNLQPQFLRPSATEEEDNAPSVFDRMYNIFSSMSYEALLPPHALWIQRLANTDAEYNTFITPEYDITIGRLDDYVNAGQSTLHVGDLPVEAMVVKHDVVWEWPDTKLGTLLCLTSQTIDAEQDPDLSQPMAINYANEDHSEEHHPYFIQVWLHKRRLEVRVYNSSDKSRVAGERISETLVKPIKCLRAIQVNDVDTTEATILLQERKTCKEIIKQEGLRREFLMAFDQVSKGLRPLQTPHNMYTCNLCC